LRLNARRKAYFDGDERLRYGGIGQNKVEAVICAWSHEKLRENACVDQAPRVINILISQQIKESDADESWQQSRPDFPSAQPLRPFGRGAPAGRSTE
jgi:hypothetical protein